MPSMYSRVFIQILDSSLAENFQTRHVFEDLLKLCNMDGVVDMTRQAIARRINAPMDMVNAAIESLEKPDPHSRDSEHEGRRIIRLDDHRDWGWRILNWQKYESIRVSADMREFNAARMANYRAKKKSPDPLEEQNQIQIYPHPQSVSNNEPTRSTTCILHSETVPDKKELQHLTEMLKKEIAAIYKRTPRTVWIYTEETALAEIARRPEAEKEWQEIKAYRIRNKGFFPRSVEVLLRGWGKTLDQARNPIKPGAKTVSQGY